MGWKDNLNSQYSSQEGYQAPVVSSGATSGSWKEKLNSVSDNYVETYMKKKQFNAINDNIEKAKAEFEKTQSGISGAVRRFIGLGQAKPQLVNETPEYTQARVASQPKSLTENLKNVGKSVKDFTKDVMTEGTTNAIYDIFYQNKVDAGGIKLIEKNNELINKLAELNRKETDENEKKRRIEMMNRIYESNVETAKEAGGELAKKTTGQLVGQSLMAALELTPFLGMKEAGKVALKLGMKSITKELAKESAKTMAKEAGFYGALAGFSSGIQDVEATPTSIAKSTAIGGAAGVGLGLGLGKIGEFFAARATKKIANKVITKIESALGKLDGDESSFVRKSIGEGLDEKVIVEELKQQRKTLTELFGEEAVETADVVTKKEAATVAEEVTKVKPIVDVKVQDPTLPNKIQADDYNKILKSKIDAVPEPKAGEVTVIKSGDGKWVDTQIDEALGRGVDVKTKVMNVKESELSLTGNAEKDLRGERLYTPKSQPLQEGGKISKPETKLPETPKQALGKPTKASRDINRSFAVQGLKEIPTEDLAKYTPQKKVDVVQRVSETMGDVKKSNRMALGLEDAPSGVDKTVLFNSVFNRAVKTGDIDLQRALAKSPIAEEASLRGQALGAAGYIRRNVVLDKLQSIVKTRKDAVAKKFGKNKISQEQKSIATVIKNKVARKMPTKEDWTKFITDITC